MGISFKEVTHSFRGIKKKEIFTALENISLDIDEKNEFIAVVGKTGSGKSTMLKHMNGLYLPTTGNVCVFDSIITPNQRKNPKLKKVRKRVGYVFQFPEYQLFEETVLKDIMFAPINFGMKPEEAKAKAISVAKLLKIEKLLNKSPFNLSGGQMRKVAIAGILAYDPNILLLDEPTRGLDPLGAKEIMEIFYQIHKETGKTIIMITHDMNLVYQYATRVVVMKDAKITFDGKKEEVFGSNIYKDNNLAKPEILELIDYLNEKLHLNISYETYTLDDLLVKLRNLKVGDSNE